MLIENLFEYKNLERITDESIGMRYYITPEKDKFYSVTTILSETSDKSGLDAWRSFVGNKEADKIVDEACRLGTLMHENLENYIQGIEMKQGGNLIRKMARKMAQSIIDNGLSQVEKVFGIEKMLYSQYGYAGTADLIIQYKGKMTIGDFKTARKLKTSEQILDYKLQISAYAHAHDELFGTNIEQGIIFMTDRDGNFREFFIDKEDLAKYKEIWFERLQTFLEKYEG